jgi:hypothetical protein
MTRVWPGCPPLSPGSRSAALALALAAVLSAACGSPRSRDARASDEWVRSYTLQEGGELQIVGGVGSIEVQGGPGSTIDVRAERVVRAATEALARPMVERVRIAEDVAPDKIVLRNEGLGGVVIGADIEINFRITVPASTKLRLRAAGGRITVTDVQGGVVASTTNGPISGTNLGGRVDARAVNGGVTLDIGTVGAEPVDARATNGSIDLRLPPGANANVEATTTNGSIVVDELPLQPMGEQSSRRVRGRLNEGGTPVALTTTNGDIRVRPRL